MPVGRLWYNQGMVRSTPAVAALLVLALTSARLLAAACEISCFYATDASHITRAAPTPSEFHCHAVVESREDFPGLLSSEQPAGCAQHASADPFVLVSKSVTSADTLDSPGAAQRGTAAHVVKGSSRDPGRIAIPVPPLPVPLRI